MKKLLLILMLPLLAKSQQQIFGLANAADPMLISTALPEIESGVDFQLHHQRTMLDIPGGPTGSTMNLRFKARPNISIGIQFNRLTAGFILTNQLHLAYGYQFRVNHSSKLLLGASLGESIVGVDFSKAVVVAPEEINSFVNVSKQASTILGFAAKYDIRNVSCFAALQRLAIFHSVLQSAQNSDHRKFTERSMASFGITRLGGTTQSDWRFFQQAVLYVGINGSISHDLQFGIWWRSKILVSIGYRQKCAYSFIRLQLSDNFCVDYGTGIGTGTPGYRFTCHEIGIRYKLNNNKTSKSSDLKQNSETQAIFDRHEQEIELQKNVNDSLKDKIHVLQETIERLRSMQLDTADVFQRIRHHVSHYSIGLDSSARFISQQFDETDAFYIVMGVYQIQHYARSYQIFLLNILNMKTALLQLDGLTYVVLNKRFDSLLKGLQGLSIVKSDVNKQPSKITRGEPWILRVHE